MEGDSYGLLGNSYSLLGGGGGGNKLTDSFPPVYLCRRGSSAQESQLKVRVSHFVDRRQIRKMNALELFLTGQIDPRTQVVY